MQPEIDTRNVVTVTDRAALDNTVAVMDLGAVAFRPCGEYKAETTYYLLDLVQWNGKGWICKSVAGTQVEPTDDATDEWMLWANNGSEGLLDQTRQALADAQKAQAAAEAAQGKAEDAQDGAETAQTAAETAQTAAETARDDAQTAKTGAETAQTAAEKALEDAKTAQTAAEAAKTGAETAAGNAEASASAASGSATEAAEAAAEAAKKAAAQIQDHPPQINKDSNTWETYSVSQGEYVDTGVYAGVDLQAGNGVKVEKTEHGAKISLPVWLCFDEDGKFCINEEDEA